MNTLLKIIIFLLVTIGLGYRFRTRLTKQSLTVLTIVMVCLALPAQVVSGLVPPMKDEITLTALREKNVEASDTQIFLLSFAVDGKAYKPTDAIKGSWLWGGWNNSAYCWLPDGHEGRNKEITDAVTLRIPVGADRSITFIKDSYCGIMRIEAGEKSLVTDTYLQDTVPIGSSTFPMRLLEQTRDLVAFTIMLLAFAAILSLAVNYQMKKEADQRLTWVRLEKRLLHFGHNRWGGCAVSFVLSLSFALTAFASCNPIWHYSGVDSACFILIGRGILAGKVPYVDFVDNKGMVLYLLNALPQALWPKITDAGSTFGIWLMELILLFLCLRVISWMARKLGVRWDLIPQLFFLLSMVSLIEMGNMGEEYSNVFCLLAFAVALRLALDGRERVSWIYGFTIGILFTLAAFIRPNNAMPIAAVILAFAVGLAVLRDFRGLGVSALSCIAGIAIVSVPIFLYLSVNHALQDCLMQTILVNFLYHGDSGNSLKEIVLSRYGAIAFGFFTVSVACVLAGHKICTGSRRIQMFFTATGLAAVFSIISAFLSGFTYLHYLLVSITPTVVALILLMGARNQTIEKVKEAEKSRDFDGFRIQVKRDKILSNLFILSMTVAIAVSFCGGLGTVVGRIQGFYPNLVNYLHEDTVVTNADCIRVFLDDIPEEERDSVYLLDDDPDWYIQNGLLPYRRLFISASRFQELIPGMRDEYGSYFKEDPPKWLVFSTDLNSASGKEYDQIRSSYEYIDSDAYGRQLYHLKNG